MAAPRGSMVRARITSMLGVPAFLAAMAFAAPAQAATLQVTGGGSDSAACTSVAPCGSFGRAYSVAKPGDVVTVRGGTYSTSQTVANDKGSTTPITFEVAAGESATINGDLTIKADYVT